MKQKIRYWSTWFFLINLPDHDQIFSNRFISLLTRATYYLWCIPFITQYYSGKRCLCVYQQSILNKMEHFMSQIVTRRVVGTWLEQGVYYNLGGGKSGSTGDWLTQKRCSKWGKGVHPFAIAVNKCKQNRRSKCLPGQRGMKSMNT